MGQTGLGKVVAMVSVALQWPELVIPLQEMSLSELRCPVVSGAEFRDRSLSYPLTKPTPLAELREPQMSELTWLRAQTHPTPGEGLGMFSFGSMEWEAGCLQTVPG